MDWKLLTSVKLTMLVSVFTLLIPAVMSKSCANLCGTVNAYSMIHDISCQCDSFCEQIGDCCQDYWDECTNKDNVELKNHMKLGNVACQTFGLRSSKNEGVYMVNSCSSEYKNATKSEDEIMQKCSMGSHWQRSKFSTTNNGLSLITPVYVNGVTFVNIFCAICNAITGDVLHWEFYYLDLIAANVPLPLPWLPKLYSNQLFRHPPKDNSSMYSVHGKSRLSKYCFIRFPGRCSTNSCTPLLCRKPFVAYCQECENVSEIRLQHCMTHFSGPQLLDAAIPIGKKGFHYDLTIIFKDGNVIANIVDNKNGVATEFHKSNCSHDEELSQETCFPSKLGCLQSQCSPTDKTGESNMGTTVLTFIGLCTSLISLILTVVICWKTESIQAKIVRLQIQCFLAHIGAILSFTGAGLVSIRASADWVCKSAAVLMHFSFLAMFSWMNVIAWSLFMMIKGTKMFLDEMVVQSPKWVESKAHYVIGWSVPMITVLISVILEYVLIPGYMGYGSHGRCWINEKKGIFYLFLVSPSFEWFSQTTNVSLRQKDLKSGP